MHNVINDSLQSGFSGLKAPPFSDQENLWKSEVTLEGVGSR